MQTCFKCNKNISYKNDANVLALRGIILKVFCNSCNPLKKRDLSIHIWCFPRIPINRGVYFWCGIFLTTIFTLMAIPLYYSNTITSPVAKGAILFIWILIVVYVWILRIVAMSKIKNLK